MSSNTTGEPEPDFTFAYTAYDDLGPSERWSSWDDLEPLMRGPEPRPDWVITSSGAIDTELGVLKTGKEADVHLVERRDPHAEGPGVVMAAKRYRTTDHRSFHRAAAYTEGRSMKRSRDNRALKRKSTWGRIVAASEWATSEWNALRVCTELGLPVPYPVQIDETEILMEWISHDGDTAPRLAQTRPDAALGASLYEQLRTALATMVGGRLRARRPVSVQHSRGGRATGHHRSAPDGRPRRQSPGDGLPPAGLRQHVRVVSSPRAPGR